jgi:hypothetical protein
MMGKKKKEKVLASVGYVCWILVALQDEVHKSRLNFITLERGKCPFTRANTIHKWLLKNIQHRQRQGHREKREADTDKDIHTSQSTHTHKHTHTHTQL